MAPLDFQILSGKCFLSSCSISMRSGYQYTEYGSQSLSNRRKLKEIQKTLLKCVLDFPFMLFLCDSRGKNIEGPRDTKYYGIYRMADVV